jgi:hypothetical protein
MGSPRSLISIVSVAAVESGPAASTFVTLPTSTPAIRTGEFVLMLVALANVALSSYGLENGAALVNTKKHTTTRKAAKSAPATGAEMR